MIYSYNGLIGSTTPKNRAKDVWRNRRIKKERSNLPTKDAFSE